MKLPSDTIGTGANKILYTTLKIAGLIAGIALLYWFVSRSNLAGIWDQLRLINVKFIFLIAATFAGYLMVTIAATPATFPCRASSSSARSAKASPR